MPDALLGLLADTKSARVIGNLADVRALKTAGFLDDLYAGNVRLLAEAARLSHVDYILIIKTTNSFRTQPKLDPDLLTCDLTLDLRLTDHSGVVVRSGRFSVTGAGFTQVEALQRAAENAAQQLQETILTLVR